MTWEKHRLIPEMVNVDQAGMTYPFYSAKYLCGVVVEFGSAYSRLRLSTIVGEYVYQSDWSELSPSLEPSATVPRILEALERCQQRAIWLCTRPVNGLTPLELTTRTWESLEPYLA